MSILLGCDYCESIRGIGPKRAIELIKTHRKIEVILDNIDKNKFVVPENWIYQQARKLFVEPEVMDTSKLEVTNNQMICIIIIVIYICY